jgi:hypothetical protein
MAIFLSTFVTDFAAGIKAADGLSPVAVNVRTKVAFQPGIGPHTEVQTVKLTMDQMVLAQRGRYEQFKLNVPYGDGTGQACDLCLGESPDWEWAIEIKMLRLMGDNGKPNDNMLMHILSPYSEHRSAVTDCRKLADSELGHRKAVLIYGYDYDEWPMDPAIDAFKLLARATVALGRQQNAVFDGLVHPVHKRGRVLAWELGG